MGGQVQLLYFAWLRERLGVNAEEIDLPDGVTTIGALTDLLRARGANWDATFSMGRVIRCAVNQEFAQADAPVKPGDEIAFFPPVTGG